MLVSLQTSFKNEFWQRLERRLVSKRVFKMLLKHSKTASRPPGSLQDAPKMLQRCLQEVSKTSKNSSKLHHVCYSCFNIRFSLFSSSLYVTSSKHSTYENPWKLLWLEIIFMYIQWDPVSRRSISFLAIDAIVNKASPCHDLSVSLPSTQ